MTSNHRVHVQIIVAFPAACEAVVLILRDHRGPVSGFVLSHLVYCDREYAYRLKMSSIFLAGWSAAVAGGLFRMHCYRVLGPQYTFQRAIIDGHQLITTGPYAIVRHPAYAGFNVYMLGTLIALLAGPGSWVTECGVLGSSTLGRFVVGAWVLCAFHFMVMAFCRCAGEDEVLRKEFGDKWVRWSQRTPARLLPGIY
ncbi:hypothetical protein L227DRAFT_501730 [Lentinus tigrinus ALCF2SS1-6]|uniref:Protein-S-isoprenylcysteine O-methyltransferase n=1 Tax=Lentinus tigrinus ALCF2SS1-6 TaxID=1328759 RepID=A0A5C2S9T7_9APHY|nr:hypothetical protein L227DRAFT_501730 [Lentinus tigrinus ALCF2SS1-6]